MHRGLSRAQDPDAELHDHPEAVLQAGHGWRRSGDRRTRRGSGPAGVQELRHIPARLRQSLDRRIQVGVLRPQRWNREAAGQGVRHDDVGGHGVCRDGTGDPDARRDRGYHDVAGQCQSNGNDLHHEIQCRGDGDGHAGKHDRISRRGDGDGHTPRQPAHDIDR